VTLGVYFVSGFLGFCMGVVRLSITLGLGLCIDCWFAVLLEIIMVAIIQCNLIVF
jgi:hypothetical protein